MEESEASGKASVNSGYSASRAWPLDMYVSCTLLDGELSDGTEGNVCSGAYGGVDAITREPPAPSACSSSDTSITSGEAERGSLATLLRAKAIKAFCFRFLTVS